MLIQKRACLIIEYKPELLKISSFLLHVCVFNIFVASNILQSYTQFFIPQLLNHEKMDKKEIRCGVLLSITCEKQC